MNRPDRDDDDDLAGLEDMLSGSGLPVGVEGLTDALAALSLGLVPAAPATDGRARLLAAAASPERRFAPFIARLARLIDVAQDRAAALLASLARPDVWERFTPAVELVHLDGGPAVADADVGFVRVAAGGAFPVHRHLGPERVLVLQGSYRDSGGDVFRAGDIVDLPAGSAHDFVALDGPDLVYAVVVRGVEFPGQDLSVAPGREITSDG